MDQVVQQFLGLGVSGAVVVAFLLGLIAPKWVVDEYRKREAAKDTIIATMTATLEALARRVDR